MTMEWYNGSLEIGRKLSDLPGIYSDRALQRRVNAAEPAWYLHSLEITMFPVKKLMQLCVKSWFVDLHFSE